MFEMPKETKEGKKRFLFFFLPLFLAQKGSSIAFAFLLKTWQQRENIVAWCGHDDGVETRMICKLTDCHCDLSTFH